MFESVWWPEASSIFFQSLGFSTKLAWWNWKKTIFASKRSIKKNMHTGAVCAIKGNPQPHAWFSQAICLVILILMAHLSKWVSSPHQWITPTKNPLKKLGWYPTPWQSWEEQMESDLGWWQWISWPGWSVPTLTNHLAYPKSNMEPLMTVWWQDPPGNLHLPDLGDPSPGASLTEFSARLEARPQKYASFVEMNIHHDDIGKNDTEDDEV